MPTVRLLELLLFWLSSWCWNVELMLSRRLVNKSTVAGSTEQLQAVLALHWPARKRRISVGLPPTTSNSTLSSVLTATYHPSHAHASTFHRLYTDRDTLAPLL